MNFLDRSIKVSVIIPTYNRANCITNAIDSVLAQTYTDYEIIVVDDGSTDKTRELLSQRYGKRIRYIYQPHAGPSAARNTGIRASQADLIAFLDSDDIWLPEKLEIQMPLMKDPDVIMSYTNWKCDLNPEKDYFSIKEISFDHSPAVIDNPAEIVSRFQGGGIMTSSMICRKSAIQRIGGFDERMDLFEDVRFRCRLSMEGKFAVTTEPLVFVYWKGFDHLNNTSFPVTRKTADLCVEIFWEFYARAVYSPKSIQKNLRRLIVHCLTRQSKYFATEHNYRMARRKAFESLAFVPKGKYFLQAIIYFTLPRSVSLIDFIHSKFIGNKD